MNKPSEYGRFPRTMEEAFGCGDHNRGRTIWEEGPKTSRGEAWFIVVCLVALAGAVAVAVTRSPQ